MWEKLNEERKCLKGKVNFLLFFPLFAWGRMLVEERETQAMLELLHPAYYSAAPALCPQAFLRLTILTTPVICGPVILPLCSAFFRRLQGLLTGPVCHADWGWGWGGGRFGLGPNGGESGAERGREWFWRGEGGGGGCNELAAMQGNRNTARLFPPLWSIHLNSCRNGREEEGRRGKKMQWHKTDVLDSIFLSSPFKSFCHFHSNSLFPHFNHLFFVCFFSCFM